MYYLPLRFDFTDSCIVYYSNERKFRTIGYLEKTFLESVKFRELLPEGSSIITAVSGGGDSVALLHLISSFREYMGWEVAVLHIDHRVRKDSGSDIVFVENLAKSLGLDFICRRLDKPTEGSLESYFSTERQIIYEETAEGKRLVATGHTANDRAETLVMRLLEGSGLRGLGGMDYCGIGPVRRPLLDFSREQLRRYLKNNGIKWLEDPSNKNDRFLRNRIRHEVIPAFEAVSPESVIAMARSSANLAMWRDLADDLIEQSLDGLMQESTFLRNDYFDKHKAVRMGILWTICQRPRSGRLEFEKTDKWLKGTDGGYHDLPGGFRFIVEGNRVTVAKSPDERRKGKPLKEPDYEILINEERIRDGVRELGAELTEIYTGIKPVVIPLLRGGFMFAADLVRSIDADLQIEFIGAASYGAQTESSGEVRLTLDTTLPLTGRHVLLVEDIVDTGLTLAYIQKLIKSREPASLRTVVLLDKKIRRKVDVDVDRVIFEIPDRFVFGYGLDSPGGFNRNLSDIVAIRK